MKKPVRIGLISATVCALVLGTVSAATGSPPTTEGNPPPAVSTDGDFGPSANQPPVAAAATLTDVENVYVPIKPCRIVDTRAAGGLLTANSYRNFYVRGTSGFAGQGGTSGGCGLPLTSVAATLSFTTVNSTGVGRINAFPYNETESNSTSITYSKTKTTANPTIKLTAYGFAPHMAVHNYNYATDLVVDVTGYFVPQISAIINSGDGIYNGTSRVVSNDNTSTGQYTVTIDRDVTGCSVTSAPYSGPYLVTAYTSSNKVYANTYYFNGGVPTLTNMYWQLQVVC